MKPKRRVGGQPAVGSGRPEVELGGVAVQAVAGRRHPLRVGVGGEQAGLLGVGAVAARDQQVEARLAAGRGGHAVEGERDVGAHRLALPVGERAVVAAAVGVARAAPGRLRDSSAVARASTASDRARRSAATRTSTPPRRVTLTRVGAKPVSGNATLTRRIRRRCGRRPCGAAARASRGRPSSRGDAGWGRRSRERRARTGARSGAHHLGRRHGGQIGAALMLAPRAERLAEGEQHERAGQQHGDDAEHEQRGLAPLAAPTTAPISAWRHNPGRSTATRYVSRPECDRSAMRSQRPPRVARERAPWERWKRSRSPPVPRRPDRASTLRAVARRLWPPTQSTCHHRYWYARWAGRHRPDRERL